MARPIRTPLLKTFTAFYGNTGYQFLEINLLDFKKCLNLTLNIFFLFLIVYHVLINDPWKSKSINHHLYLLRPFVALITSTTLHICHLLLALKMLYYFAKGRQVVDLLDNDYFYQVYETCSSKLFIIFFIVLICVHGFFLNPSVVVDGQTGDEHFSLVKGILNAFAVFFSGSSLYLDYYILHYRQYGNLRTLETIIKKSQTSKEVQKSLKSLATINDELNFLLTFPLLISLLITFLSTITVFCTVFIVKGDFTFYLISNLVYILGGYFYVVYLAHLNSQVLATFDKIFVNFEKEVHVNAKVIEVDLYRDNFKVPLFGLTVLNLKTLFSAALFSIGFIVFLFQTN